ncbi:hypothetical protein LJC02_04205 [Breznakia sp. OttesenSCG-928-G09]|nr:hypothetical protein [Breznakia sp. OttesenSCG-928-G09]
MIFVTLGTQDKSFHRLLESIESMIEEEIITDLVVVQAGYTKFESKHMEIVDYVEMDKFEKYIDSCDLLITHGGVGSILSGCLAHKKVLAVSRLEQYNEHENDHQIQIVREFTKRNYILGCFDAKDLKKTYISVKDFKPTEYIPNNEHICNMIVDYINNI